MMADSKKFDWELFEKLCGFPDVITQKDIANAMGVSVDTCERRIQERFNNPEGEHVTFAGFREQKQASFRISLLNAQIKKAIHSKNTIMQIWLGKQYLGQKDKHEFTTNDTKPIIFQYNLNTPPEKSSKLGAETVPLEIEAKKVE